MLITLCLIILGYMIVGKDVKPWVEKLKSVDWKSKADSVICKIKEYAVKTGRVAVRPLLQYIISSVFLMKVLRLHSFTRRSRIRLLLQSI